MSPAPGHSLSFMAFSIASGTEAAAAPVRREELKQGVPELLWRWESTLSGGGRCAQRVSLGLRGAAWPD